MDIVPNYEVLTFEPLEVLMISILVLYAGMYLNKKIRLLEVNYIPPSVTGGILCSVVVALFYKLGNIEINFDMQIRDKNKDAAEHSPFIQVV